MDSLAQAYHWPLEKIFSLTWPQIIMLCHGAHINGKRFEEKTKKKDSVNVSYDYKDETQGQDFGITDPNLKNPDFDPIVSKGNKLSDLKKEENFDKLADYLKTLVMPI